MRIISIPPGFLLCCLLFCSCKTDTANLRENGIKEIAQAEKDFEKMAAEKGIAEAFWYYADPNAVIRRRNDSLIKGKEGIKNFYSADYFKTASVKWSPDFIDIAENGVFHTVWKKQKDGSWKYVWD